MLKELKDMLTVGKNLEGDDTSKPTIDGDLADFAATGLKSLPSALLGTLINLLDAVCDT